MTRIRPSTVFSALIYILQGCTCASFGMTIRSRRDIVFTLQRESSDDAQNAEIDSIVGDPLRAATGIRPSLHPMTINGIANALLLRAKRMPDKPLRVATAEPLQVALTAGQVAAEAVQSRQATSAADNMQLMAAEKQAVAGRIVGVCMRLDELENELRDRCRAVPWIQKYGEGSRFGLLPTELQDDNSKIVDNSEVDAQLKDNPLLRMARAECLLALFLHTVEARTLADSTGASVPDDGRIDFMDDDRKAVLVTAPTP